MASTHTALFAYTDLTRDEIYNRLLLVLQKHEIRFSHSVRGLAWDSDINRFMPVAEQELEHVLSFGDAIAQTSDWSCVCFDLRFIQWDFEFLVFNDEMNRRSYQSIAFKFPNSLYKWASEKPEIAALWLSLLEDVGIALEGIGMICGPNVEMHTIEESFMIKQFADFNTQIHKESNGIHTALIPSLKYMVVVEKVKSSRRFFVEVLSSGYLLMTLLKAL